MSTINNEYFPLEWNDIGDVTPSVSSTEEEEDQYRYVDCSNNRKYKKLPIHFSLSVTRIDGDSNKKTCHPGSIFEGMVHIKLDSPFAAQYLKVVFKAAEQIHGNYSISSKKEVIKKKKGERLFAIHSIQWGSISATKQWPIMEAGIHQFPFMCELPMVNYPPSFRHHLASCEFEIVAILERPGIRHFQTVPYLLRYEPYVVSSPIKSSQLYQERITISNNQYKMQVTLLKGNHFNLLDTNPVLKVQLSLIPLGDNAAATAPVSLLNHMETCIKREVTVTHGSWQRTDTMVMTHTNQFILQQQKNGTSTLFIQLSIPSSLNKKNNATITNNFDVLGMTPTLNFSQHVKMDYKLYITAKIKHGLISTVKRQFFCIPIQFGTVATGEQLPSSLLFYRDAQVMSDTTLQTKPRFVRPPSGKEQLPAYNEDLSPPIYTSVATTHSRRFRVS